MEIKEIKIGEITLRTAQINLINKLDETVKNGFNKACFIFPTGLGKSYGSFSHALRYIIAYEERTKKKGKILILVHTGDLIKQHKKDFERLCKDRDIGLLYKSQKDFKQRVIIANVRTLKNHLHKFKEDEFQYIIVDETHHATAKTWNTILNYFKPLFLLGMTATPQRTDAEDIYPIYDNNKVLEYTEKECFDNKWLRPYDMLSLWDHWCDYGDIGGYYNKGIFMYNMKKVGRKYIVPERITGIINTLKKGCKKALKNSDGKVFYFKGTEDRKGIYFLPKVEAVKKYCKEFNKAGIKSNYIVDKTNPKQREKIFKDFEEGKIQFIFNVNVIKEGMHPKGVDLVVIDRPTDSYILWVQAKGRQLFNIEGEEYDRKGLVLDLVGNNKNSFNKHITGSDGTKKGRSIPKLVEMSIGVPCFFESEVINYFEEIEKRMPKTLDENIEWFRKKYGNKKIKRSELKKESHSMYVQLRITERFDEFCIGSRYKTLDEHIDWFRKKYGNKKIRRSELEKENTAMSKILYTHGRTDEFCLPRYSKKITNPNITIIKNYKPKTIIIPIKKKKTGKGKIRQIGEGWGEYNYKKDMSKIDIRKKIIKEINDGDTILLLESPDLSAIREIMKQGKKPKKIVIPNDKEFDKLSKELKSLETDLKIELINTSALLYLVNSTEKFDFVWLDYCGGFSYYIKDLEILFQKHFKDMKLILTYNLFDPIKEDSSYYFTRVIDYVLSKRNSVRLINDITHRYKKNMYNVGFNIQEIKANYNETTKRHN